MSRTKEELQKKLRLSDAAASSSLRQSSQTVGENAAPAHESATLSKQNDSDSTAAAKPVNLDIVHASTRHYTSMCMHLTVNVMQILHIPYDSVGKPDSQCVRAWADVLVLAALQAAAHSTARLGWLCAFFRVPEFGKIHPILHEYALVAALLIDARNIHRFICTGQVDKEPLQQAPLRDHDKSGNTASPEKKTVSEYLCAWGKGGR